MRARVIPFTILASLVSVGCATAGQPSEDTGTVPVYQSVGEVPCEYEVLRTVRAEVTHTIGVESPQQVQRTLTRELGRVGRDAGADGVLVLPDPGPATAELVTAGTPKTAVIMGEAVKCVRASHKS